MRVRSICFTGALLIAGLVFGGATAPIEAQGHLGFAAGVYVPEDDQLDNNESLSVRGGYRFHPNFGFEGSLSQVELADDIPGDIGLPLFDTDFNLDLYTLDLTFQWFPRGGNFVIFAGPGAARIDSDFRFSFLDMSFSGDEATEVLTAHAGLGYEWRLGERFFLRPEARVRRYFDDDAELPADDEAEVAISYDSTDYEASLMFGWRIGD